MEAVKIFTAVDEGSKKEERIMSKKLWKNTEDSIGVIERVGTEGGIEDIPIDVQAIPGQRPTQRAKIKEHFDKEGKDLGYNKPVFSYALWSPPQVARLHNPKTDKTELFLFDGDHRRHMWALAHPADETMKGWVVTVSTIEEAIALFIKYNKTRRDSITPEALFICRWFLGDTDAIETGKLLKRLGLRVAADPTVIDPNHSVPPQSIKPHIPISAFLRSVKLCTDSKGVVNEKPLAYAANTLNSWGANQEKFGSEEFMALTAFGFYYPKYLADASMQKFLEGHLSSCFANEGRASTFKEWKARGGNVHAMAAQSIVLGMVDSARNNSRMPLGFKQYVTKTKINKVLAKAKK